MTIVIMMTAATSESATVAMEEGMEEAITTVATIREEAVAAGTRAAARASTGVFTLGRKRRAWPPTPPPMLGLQVWLAGLKLTRRRLDLQVWLAGLKLVRRRLGLHVWLAGLKLTRRRLRVGLTLSRRRLLRVMARVENSARCFIRTTRTSVRRCLALAHTMA